MQSSLPTAGITEGPAAPLSPRMRNELRADRPPAPAPFVRTEAGGRLARALDRFARGTRDREAWLVYAPPGSGRTTVVLRAVEQAMTARTWLARPSQLLPVPIRMVALWDDSETRLGELILLAKHMAIAVTEELVSRLEVRAGDDAARTEAVASLWRILPGRPTRDEILQLRRAADADFEPDEERISREATVLFEASRLRNYQPPAPVVATAPVVAPVSMVPAPMVVDQGQIKSRLTALEGDVSEVSALASGLAAGACVAVFNPAYGVAAGLLVASVRWFTLAARRRGEETSEDALDLDPTSSPNRDTMEMSHTDIPAPPEQEMPRDAVEMSDRLQRFVRDVREIGLAPVFIVDELDRVDASRNKVEVRVRRLLADLVPGTSAILVADQDDFVDGAPEVTERLPVLYMPRALHGYLDRRMPISAALSGPALADAKTDQGVLRYAMLHAARLRPEELDRLLAERRLGDVQLDAGAARDVFTLRIRAAQEMALEIVLRERAAHAAADPAFGRRLAAALQLPLRQWEAGIDPDVRDEVLARHLDRTEERGAWVTSSEIERRRIRDAVLRLLDLMTSRAGLVSQLAPAMTALADVIPDASLLLRRGGVWVWAFDPDGAPRTAASLAAVAQRGTVQDANTNAVLGGRRTRNDDFAAPRRINDGDSIPLTGSMPAVRLDADDVAEMRDTVPGLPQVADEGTTTEQPRLEVEGEESGQEAAQVTALDAAQFIDAVDDALSQFGDGTLSVARLVRSGLIPSVPSPAAYNRALADDTSAGAKVVLAEVVARIRDRLGVLDKFLIWVAAADALVVEGTTTAQVAETIVVARALAGRSVADQHARLTLRSLQGELRSVCPKIREAASVFRRTATPGTDADALTQWADSLRKRASQLNEALDGQVKPETLDVGAWASFRARMRSVVMDGESRLPAIAEVVAHLGGRATAELSDWLGGTPTARQLSKILMSARKYATSDRLGDTGLYASVALGLNRNGLEAAGLELPEVETSEAGDAVHRAGTAQGPVVLVLAGDVPQRLAGGPAPKRGSALVLQPEEVNMRLDKLGFEAIFLDDPSIDAGMLPLPSAHVLEPPLADSIDDGLDWWMTHR